MYQIAYETYISTYHRFRGSSCGHLCLFILWLLLLVETHGDVYHCQGCNRDQEDRARA